MILLFYLCWLKHGRWSCCFVCADSSRVHDPVVLSVLTYALLMILLIYLCWLMHCWWYCWFICANLCVVDPVVLSVLTYALLILFIYMCWTYAGWRKPLPHPAPVPVRSAPSAARIWTARSLARMDQTVGTRFPSTLSLSYRRHCLGTYQPLWSTFLTLMRKVGCCHSNISSHHSWHRWGR